MNDDTSNMSLICKVIKHSVTQPDATAIRFKLDTLTYKQLIETTAMLSNSLLASGLAQGSRVAVLLPNCPESVVAALASFAIGHIYVPVNPLLRRRQLLHVIQNSGAKVLITTKYLFAPMAEDQDFVGQLERVILTDDHSCEPVRISGSTTSVQSMRQLTESSSVKFAKDCSSLEMERPAVLFYTSGSTGKAKGVLTSYRNISDGARIVAGYLGNDADDCILAALPLSFDYGFSQVTTALYAGGQVVLTNYTLPQPLLSEVLRYKITGLAGVPTMWSQLAAAGWPDGDYTALRYITNSGGRLPKSVLSLLRSRLPDVSVYLMYGLTEAFRSSYLAPDLIEERPDSIGKAIPGVDLFVLNDKGDICRPDEPGELVHCGALVTLGYWDDPDATHTKFRPLPKNISKSDSATLALWTGDIVRSDSDGFLYFLDRNDSMMKCSGYRISPSEIEDVIIESDLASDVVAVGIPDTQGAQQVGVAVIAGSEHEDYDFAIRHICARELPPYMQPTQILVLKQFPLTANGKPDRTSIAKLFRSVTQVNSGN